MYTQLEENEFKELYDLTSKIELFPGSLSEYHQYHGETLHRDFRKENGRFEFIKTNHRDKLISLDGIVGLEFLRNNPDCCALIYYGLSPMNVNYGYGIPIKDTKKAKYSGGMGEITFGGGC